MILPDKPDKEFTDFIKNWSGSHSYNPGEKTEIRRPDMEDIARMLLIRDLKEDFGVNDESIPVILYLIDQLH